MTQNNKKKETSELGYVMFMLMFLVIWGMVIFLLWSYVVKPATDIDKALNNFCEDKGFIEVTDWKLDSAFNPKYADVECDKDNKFHTRIDYECIYEDKWGDCTRRQVKVE